MKIHIIGCSGTGKTYLAKFFAEKYSIPHFDLDDIQWDNSAESCGVLWRRNKGSCSSEFGGVDVDNASLPVWTKLYAQTTTPRSCVLVTGQKK